MIGLEEIILRYWSITLGSMDWNIPSVETIRENESREGTCCGLDGFNAWVSKAVMIPYC